MTAWNLYLDDIRTPYPLGDWTIARSVAEAQELIAKNGMPNIMSLDHDLGLYQCPQCVEDQCYDGDDTGNCNCKNDGCHAILPTGYDFIKWLINTDHFNWPLNINVHSANVVGAANMRGLIESRHRFLHLFPENGRWIK